MMRRSPVVGAAFGLLFFYWTALFLLDLMTGQIGLSTEWVTRMRDRGVAIAIGAFAGVALVGYGMWLKRKLARMRLIGDDVRGVMCSIGELPVMLQAPVQAEKVISPQDMRLPRHKCIARNWMRDWFKKYEQDFPGHAKMLRACERVMNAKPTLPAACKNGVKKDYAYGYDGHNHGNHTLVEHAYVTGAVGVHLSASFNFDGTFVVNAQGEKEGVSKKNPNYKFNACDPMVGLLCYAHDVGKIETFGLNDRGEVIALEGEHDLAGARLMARMEEFWELPDEDRMILLLAVSNYHTPSKMPMDREGQLISDRCQALLDLMIEADIRAGLIENGQEDELGKVRAVPIVESTYTGHLWDAFTDLVIEAGRINGERDKFGIGQKNVVDNRTLIVVYEKDVREELLKRMELRNSHKGKADEDGVKVLTRDLLRVIDKKGMLVLEWGDIKAGSPDEALWQVDWYGRDPKRLGAPISKSLCTIVFEPKGELERLAEMKDHHSVPKLVGLFRDERRIDKRQSALTDAIAMSDPDKWLVTEKDGSVQLAGEGKKKSKKKGNAESKLIESQKLNTGPMKEADKTASSAEDTEGIRANDDAHKPELREPSVPQKGATEKPVSNDKNASMTDAVKAIQEQLKRRAAAASKQGVWQGPKQGVRQMKEPSEEERVKNGLLQVIGLVSQGELPYNELGDGRISVAIDAMKAMSQGIPWLNQKVVTCFVRRRWPGVRFTQRATGVFMLEIDVEVVERTDPPQIDNKEEQEA
jgi:hypothetical protein